MGSPEAARDAVLGFSEIRKREPLFVRVGVPIYRDCNVSVFHNLSTTDNPSEHCHSTRGFHSKLA